MEKLASLFDLFRKGNAVADPALFKNGAMAISLLVPLLLSVARVANAFGVELVITEADAATLAAGVVSLVGIVSHLITSKTVGLPAKDVPASPAPVQAPVAPGIGDGTA